MSDPNRVYAEQVIGRLRGAGYHALLAGGCVRDLLLGRVPKDYDVATDATPEQVRNLFGPRRTLAIGASFGVIVVLPPHAERAAGVAQIEVATFRTEGGYVDGRRPQHVAYATPQEDAQRRDFTINGLFLDPLSGDVFDYVGGQADLRAGVIRAIGNPADRMTEDKLRLLRAVRFTATLDFRLDPATAAAVTQMAPQLGVVSAERIAAELRRMLVDRHRRRALELCCDTGLLAVVAPEIATNNASWRRTLTMSEMLNEPTFELALATLIVQASGGGEPPEYSMHSDRSTWRADASRAPQKLTTICERLRLSNAESERIAFLTTQQTALENAAALPLSRLKRLASRPGIAELVELTRIAALADDRVPADAAFVAAFLRDTPPEVIDPPPLLTGADLIAAGLRPGPAFKTLLETVRDAQLDARISTNAEALALARRLQSLDADATNTRT